MKNFLLKSDEKIFSRIWLNQDPNRAGKFLAEKYICDA
jgi:hypothetical protein